MALLVELFPLYLARFFLFVFYWYQGCLLRALPGNLLTAIFLSAIDRVLPIAWGKTLSWADGGAIIIVIGLRVLRLNDSFARG